MAYDAVIIGAGHNGLAAAIILADSGWKVLVLERNPVAGGALQTAEVTLPRFRHDLFAANLNLFASSPFFAEYGERLIGHGLEFAPSSHPFSSVFPGGKFIGVSTDLDATLDRIRTFSAKDAESWSALNSWFEASAPHMFPLLGLPLPSFAAIRQMLRGARTMGRAWPMRLVRLVLQSTREFVEEHFESKEIQALSAVWGMHLDYAPDVSGGALFPFIETFADGANGMVLGKGGASTIIDAQIALLKSLGGEVRLSSPVESVVVRRKKAVAVVLADGEEIDASRAIVANLTPKVLFGGLVPRDSVPEKFSNQVDAYKHAPGTMMIHLAMDDLPPWKAEGARDYAYVHIAPYMEDMSLAYQRAVAGLLPEQPTLVVGQPTSVDASRAPAGKHVLWIQVRMVPGIILGDASGEIETRDWGEAKEAYADRVMAIVESYAPGTADLILGRKVLSPEDLENANPNLIGGDSLGGSHHLMQHFFMRPFPGWTKYETPLKHLFMVGAANWPGAGVGAGSGYLLGKKLTKPGLRDRIRL